MRLVLLALAITASAPEPAHDQPAELPTWMLGHWISCADGVQVTETMQGDPRGALLGSNLTVGRQTGFEFYRIARNAHGAITFFAQPRGSPAVEFPAKRLDDTRVVFENLEHDFPQRILYWREGSGLAARIEGTLQGTAESEEWHFVPAVPGQACNFGGAAAAVANTEREFAAAGAEHGFAWAFRRYHAPGALVLQPDPLPAEVTLARVPGDGGKGLAWKPVFAGASLSGDLGFTTGPYRQGGNEHAAGHYFTVWQLQPNGRWQWLFDGGTGVADPQPYSTPQEPALLPVVRVGAGSAEAALAAVAAAEGTEGFRVASYLSAESRVNRAGAAPAVGQQASAALLANESAFRFSPLVRRASAAGDMVFTLGEVREGTDEQAPPSYYARIWQLTQDGWRIIFDEIVPRRT